MTSDHSPPRPPVTVRGLLGRLYMLPVGIGHHWVLADMFDRLRTAAEAPASSPLR